MPEFLKEEGFLVEVHSISDRKLESILERSVRFGMTLVLTQGDEMDPICMDVIERQYQNLIHRSKRARIGRKWIDVHEKFRFVIIATNDQRLPMHARKYINLIDFSIAEIELEGEK